MLAIALIAHSRLLVRRMSGGGSSGWAGGVGERADHRVVRTRPQVQHERGMALPRSFLVAHHQRADPGGGSPVDLAKVVAMPVLAGRSVIGAVRSDRVTAGVLADIHRIRRLGLRKSVDDRRDHERRRGRKRPRGIDEPERVGEPHPQRSGAVSPTAEPGQAVGHAAGFPARQAVEREASAASDLDRQPVLQHERTGGQHRAVGHGECDRHVGAERGPRRGDRASAGDRQLGAVDHERSDDRSGEHQAAGASEIDAAEQQSAHEGRQPCGEQAPPASGESGAQPLEPG